jgi:Mannosyltransferase (PIG-M)
MPGHHRKSRSRSNQLSQNDCEPENHTFYNDQRPHVFTSGSRMLCYVSTIVLSLCLNLTIFSWGQPFLYESYLYHLQRLDHRHNFSPYFYLTYLTYPSIDLANFEPLSSWSRILRSPLTSFVPQMGLALELGLLFGRRKEDLAFTWFLQTVVFVVFNKVCTSQVRVSNFIVLQMIFFTHTPSLSTSYGTSFSYHSSFHNYLCRAAKL